MKRGTPEHPKTKMLAALLDVPLAQAVGHLEMLFHWTAKYARAGDIGRWPDEVIAEGCGWQGDPARFIEALLNAKGAGSRGWIEERPGHRLVVHDWSEHADDCTKKVLDKRGEVFADGTAPFPNRKGQTDPKKDGRIPEPFQNDSGTIPDSLSLSLSQSQDKECSAPQGDAKPDGTPFLEFPCSGKLKVWTLTREKLEEYHALYGNQIDVRQEAKKARQWVIDNPSKRKTARGMPKFLNGWFTRAVDRGGVRA